MNRLAPALLSFACGALRSSKRSFKVHLQQTCTIVSGFGKGQNNENKKVINSLCENPLELRYVPLSAKTGWVSEHVTLKKPHAETTQLSVT